MPGNERRGDLLAGAKRFDVICAGEALLSVANAGGVVPAPPSLAFRSGGGAMSAALRIAEQGLRVGLASVLADDTSSRALLARVAAAGVDVGGVTLEAPTGALMFVRGGARQVVSTHEEKPPVSVPEAWSSQVLLVSGVSPVVAHGAALCRAARAARRAGAVVVVDLSARWEIWQGRDARAVLMLLREADVVWCSAPDLFGLAMDLQTVRGGLRKTAVLVASDGTGRALAAGPFGEVSQARDRAAAAAAPLAEGDAFTAAICSELARATRAEDGGGGLWTRALRRGHAAVMQAAR
jgi:2-dehydro-3-deoxygluconokinase